MSEEKEKKSYWEKRKEQFDKALQESEEELKKRLAKYYQTEYEKLDKEIAAYYTQYGRENVIAYREMMLKLSNSEIRLLMEKMDDFAELYPQYAHLMPVRASIYKLNRLEGLQTSVRLQQMKIAAVTEKEVEEHLSKLALNSANESMERLGFGKTFYSINSEIVKTVVYTKWTNGKNFSERIWGNTDKLAEYLSTDIAQGFARGDNYNKLANQLRSRFVGVSTRDAMRLIFTEGTFVKNEASIKPFEEDFEYYRIVTRQNDRVCDFCKELEQKKIKFRISERKPKVNFPPFHVNCGCSYEIVVDDRDEWLDNYVNSRVKEELNKQLDKLDKKEKDIINAYTGNLAFNLNSSLNFGKSNKYKSEIDLIDKALNKGVFPFNLPVYRKTDMGFLLGKGKYTSDDVKSLIGSKKIEKGYTSTSLNGFDTVNLKGRNAYITFRVPEDYKGALYIKSLAKDQFKSQEEVLFKRNMCYTILDIKEQDGIYYIEAEVLKDE